MNSPIRNAELQLPHNIEAEQGLLGAILVNNDALHRVVGFLQPEDFLNRFTDRSMASLEH